MSSRYCRHIAGTYGRLAALALIVGLAGCAASDDRRCLHDEVARLPGEEFGSYCNNGCAISANSCLGGYHATMWHPMAIAAGAGGTVLHGQPQCCAVPTQEEIPAPQSIEPERPLRDFGSGPSLPETPGDGQPFGSAYRDPVSRPMANPIIRASCTQSVVPLPPVNRGTP